MVRKFPPFRSERKKEDYLWRQSTIFERFFSGQLLFHLTFNRHFPYFFLYQGTHPTCLEYFILKYFLVNFVKSLHMFFLILYEKYILGQGPGQQMKLAKIICIDLQLFKGDCNNLKPYLSKLVTLWMNYINFRPVSEPVTSRVHESYSPETDFVG